MFRGLIDEVYIFGNVLSLADIVALQPATWHGRGTATTLASADPLRIHSIALDELGHAHLRLRAEANRAFLIEASPNLVDWVEIGIGTTGRDGAMEFIDPEPAIEPARFYRVRAR